MYLPLPSVLLTFYLPLPSVLLTLHLPLPSVLLTFYLPLPSVLLTFYLPLPSVLLTLYLSLPSVLLTLHSAYSPKPPSPLHDASITLHSSSQREVRAQSSISEGAVLQQGDKLVSLIKKRMQVAGSL